MLIFSIILNTVSAQWDYRPIHFEDPILSSCQYYTKPCQHPTAFPVLRRSAAAIIYKTWAKEDIDNLCPGNQCGPFCNKTDPACFVQYRIPKDPDDKTEGGRTLPKPFGSTDPAGGLNETYCPPDCCTSENCKRYRDVTGQPVPESHEIMLIFGGTGMRNVSVNGELLFNDCSDDNVKLAEEKYGLEVTQSCGLELLNEIWRYDISTNEWSYLEPTYPPDRVSFSFPYPRHSHSAALIELVVFDDYIKKTTLKKYLYIYGGFALECRDACSDMWRFEIPWASQRFYPESSGFWNRGGYWQELTQNYSPGERMSHGFGASGDSKYIYFFGGIGNNKLYNDLWRYRVLDNVWEEISTLGISKVTRTVTTWNGTVYDLIVNISEKRVGDNIYYSASGSKPNERLSTAFLYFKGSSDYVFVFGGLGSRTRLFDLGTTSVALNDFWVLSVKSNKWTQVFSDTVGPSARFDASIVQLDEQRLAVYGGRHGDLVFNDFWVYNINTNHWFNWTVNLAAGSSYPEGRFKGIFLKTSTGLLVYSGTYTRATNLSITDLLTNDYMTYVAECKDELDLYGFKIVNIGLPGFKSVQQKLYQETNNSCFLRTDPIPTFQGDVQFLQGVWYFDLTICDQNCSQHGFCEFGTCYCEDQFYGTVCESLACPGTFCIYDSEFFSTAECIHCSGYGSCVNGTCNCSEGYSGDDCSKQSCRNNCSNSGDCVEIYPVSQCDCFGRNGGDTCDVVLCLNKCNDPFGSCNLTTGLCTCTAGFYGVDCSVVGLAGSGALSVLFYLFVVCS